MSMHFRKNGSIRSDSEWFDCRVYYKRGYHVKEEHKMTEAGWWAVGLGVAAAVWAGFVFIGSLLVSMGVIVL